jgi:hypothetical protein
VVGSWSGESSLGRKLLIALTHNSTRMPRTNEDGRRANPAGPAASARRTRGVTPTPLSADAGSPRNRDAFGTPSRVVTPRGRCASKLQIQALEMSADVGWLDSDRGEAKSHNCAAVFGIFCTDRAIVLVDNLPNDCKAES